MKKINLRTSFFHKILMTVMDISSKYEYWSLICDFDNRSEIMLPHEIIGPQIINTIKEKL